MAKTIEEISIEMANLEEQIRPLNSRLMDLHHELILLRSQEFIRSNNVTPKDVEMSSGDGKPWFGHCVAFGDWLRQTACQKRFCEWNHRIYFTAEVVQGKWDHNMPGRIDDLETD